MASRNRLPVSSVLSHDPVRLSAKCPSRSGFQIFVVASFAGIGLAPSAFLPRRSSTHFPDRLLRQLPGFVVHRGVCHRVRHFLPSVFPACIVATNHDANSGASGAPVQRWVLAILLRSGSLPITQTKLLRSAPRSGHSRPVGCALDFASVAIMQPFNPKGEHHVRHT